MAPERAPFLLGCAWFDKLTMREVVWRKINHKPCRIVLTAILHFPHGELVEPRTAELQSIPTGLSGHQLLAVGPFLLR